MSQRNRPAGSKDDDSATMRGTTRSHYEAFPFISGGARRQRHWWRRIEGHIGEVAGRTIVDVGCGAGDLAVELRRRGGQVVALDLTRRAVELTGSRGVPTLQADALKLPLLDGSADAVTAIGVLHHTPDCLRGLEELSRVVRPGGRVVIMIYARWTPYQALYLATRPLRAKLDAGVLRRLPRPLLASARFAVRLQVGQRYSDEEVRSLLGDQIFTPRATFHSATELVRCAAENNLVLVKRTPLRFHGNVLGFQRL